MKHVLTSFVLASAAVAASENQLPSRDSFFRFAAMELQCREAGHSAMEELEAYRRHTIDYYQSGAAGSDASAEDRISAIKDLETKEIPKSYVDQVRAAMTEAPPTQRQVACRNLGQILQLQIRIENLSVGEARGRK